MTSRASGRRSGEDQSSRLIELGPIVFVVVLSVVVLAGLGVLPAKTWFSQRQKTTDARDRMTDISTETDRLERELARLQTDEEIERRARKDFDLVYPGEESYRIVPPDQEP